MSSAPTASAIVEELRGEPNISELAGHVRGAALTAAAGRDHSFLAGRPSLVGGLTGADTPGDLSERARTILAAGALSDGDAMLIGALLALSLRYLERPITTVEAGQLVWLATHTSCNALEALDAALEGQADQVWQVIREVVRAPQTVAADLGRAEALVGAAALRASHSEGAHDVAMQLARECKDRALRLFLLGPKRREHAAALTGELTSPPRGALSTALLTVTLILPALQIGRVLARFAFAYRRSARVRLSARGLELEYRTELLGRILNDTAILIPLANLSRVTREVRYARAGLYAGLAALIAGTYFGMGLFVDGVRVPGGSMPLLGLAFLMMFAGLAIDFGLSYLSDGLRGRCRLLVVPRVGKLLCIAELDPGRADAMLSTIAEQLQS